ncbi:hypothetical protein L226DRAFT_532935 [Lentinus tigrinus ALCF2SS1-7]|uniref:uncharacterized protein n=1 Tax=Lentinus tigrinus ALCF2SS1-7 TaxID=1328758 RepID=UPI0011661AD5|nr:hypothetical protein L226DRAFT_532935 [Lentinus tigrinus ALCF2SS1-7]
MFGPNSFKHLNKDLPRLRTLVWFPAWGDVEDLGPGMQYVEDVREDVFAFLKVRTFAVMLPRERCVRFESSKEEPHYTIVPRNRFDDLGWRAT